MPLREEIFQPIKVSRQLVVTMYCLPFPYFQAQEQVGLRHSMLPFMTAANDC